MPSPDSLADGCEAVVLSTCNRTEIYLAAERRSRAGPSRHHRAARAWPVPRRHRWSPSCIGWRTSPPRCTCSVSPPGSTRSCRARARSWARCATPSTPGAPGPLLDRLFRNALHAGRRARVETAIGESPASVPAAAAALAQQVFDDLDGRPVVLVGAGKMSELTARNLRSRGAVVSAVANRTAAHGEELARRLGARAIGLDESAAELGARRRRRRIDQRAGVRARRRRARRRASSSPWPPDPARRPRCPARRRPGARLHRRVLRVRHRRSRGRRRGVTLRSPRRGGASRAYRCRGGGALQGVAGVACGRAGHRVASRPRRGDPRRRARTRRRAARAGSPRASVAPSRRSPRRS